MGNVIRQCTGGDDKPEEKVALAQDIKKVAKKVDVKSILSVIRWNRDDGALALIESDQAAVCAARDPQNGNCAIHLAAQNGHRHVVAALIKAGADINARTVIVTSRHKPRPFPPRTPRRFQVFPRREAKPRTRRAHADPSLPSNDGWLSHSPPVSAQPQTRAEAPHTLLPAGCRKSGVHVYVVVVVAGACRKDANLALAPITTRTCTFDLLSPSRRQ
jgi:hypothetical protein